MATKLIPEKPTTFNVTEIKTNFIYPEITSENFKFGSGELTGTPLREDADWRGYLPPEEDQRIRGIESSACYVEAQQHTIATIEEEQFNEIDNNYSSRFNALLSGGTRQGGNPIAAADSMRHDGMIADALMPFGDDIQTWEDFHSWKGVDETSLRTGGKRYLETKALGHDIVFERWETPEAKFKKARAALNFSPLPVSVAAWYEKDGIYYKPVGATDNHLVELVYIDADNHPYIRDTYAPYLKKLEPFFNFDFGMRWSVEKKTAPQAPQTSIWPQWLLDLINSLKPLPAAPQPQPMPQPIPKPLDLTTKLLWNTPANARHSVRVICDQFLPLKRTVLIDGKYYLPKDVITAVIQGESGFKNSAKRNNYRKDGSLHSTDWGICQVNDYYHVGLNKKWSSVKQILDNPDKVVKWMISLYSQGQLKLWVAFSSGAYKRYLPKTAAVGAELQTNQNNMNNSKPFSLNSADVFRSALLGVLVAVLGGLQQMLTQHGFDFATYDWAMILNLAITSALAQLGINFASNTDRTVNTGLGSIGPKA